MKKLGLITFHDTNNFGSWLQTYALYKKLADIGITVEVIDYRCDEIIRREKLTLHSVNEILLKKSGEVYLILLKRLIKQFFFWLYSQKYIRVSRIKYNRINIKSANAKYDVFMIGSDLVWDTRVTNRDFTYMADFAEESKRKISYAASLGYERIPDNELKEYKRCLSRFHSISVREESAEKLLKDIVSVPIEVVSDPTMLLTKKEWLHFVKKTSKFEDYVLVYFVDDKEKILRVARQYARNHRCKVLVISDWRVGGAVNISPYSISDFLTLIYYAKKVFTASYHGVLFSLYFEKQLAFCNRKPEDRMKSLADRMGIANYEINADGFDVETKIDYGDVTLKINEFRKKSMYQLKTMLEDR